MVTSAVDPPGAFGYLDRSRHVNRPRTLASMKWRPMKSTSVWPGSTCYWLGAGSSAPPAGGDGTGGRPFRTAILPAEPMEAIEAPNRRSASRQSGHSRRAWLLLGPGVSAQNTPGSRGLVRGIGESSP